MNVFWSLPLQARCVKLLGGEKAEDVMRYARQLGAIKISKGVVTFGVEFRGQDRYMTQEELTRELNIKPGRKS